MSNHAIALTGSPDTDCDRHERSKSAPLRKIVSDEKTKAPSCVIQTDNAGDITLRIFDTLENIEPVWRVLETEGLCSVYQRFDWAVPWFNHVGTALAMTPAVVAGFSGSKPLFLLPLATRNRGPFRILTSLADNHTNFNIGLFSGEFLKDLHANDMTAIFKGIKELVPKIDAIEFCCQPLEWNGTVNPLSLLARHPSHTNAYGLKLTPDFDAVLSARNGKRKRKKFRASARRFEEAGGYRFLQAENEDEVDRFLHAALGQMAVRLEKTGVVNVFADHGVRNFLRDTLVRSLAQMRPAMTIYALEVDGKIRATFCGGGHGKQFSGNFISFADDQLANASPGDFLLHLVIGDCANKGYTDFDLGRGEERYKRSWCDITIPMFETYIPISRLAWAFGIYERAKSSTKRTVRQNANLWSFAKRVRKLLYGWM